MKEQKLIFSVLGYLAVLLCSVTAAAIVWNGFVQGVLYECTDPLPRFWPPFVHSGSNDAYLVPKALVLTIWAALVLAAFSLPALVLKVLGAITLRR